MHERLLSLEYYKYLTIGACAERGMVPGLSFVHYYATMREFPVPLLQIII